MPFGKPTGINIEGVLRRQVETLKSENLAIALELEEARKALKASQTALIVRIEQERTDATLDLIRRTLSRPSPSSERAKAYMDVVEAARLHNGNPYNQLIDAIARLDAIEGKP